MAVGFSLKSGRFQWKSGAFTLIELLVVIAVIGILAAMLLPTLSSAKSRAQGIQCISNLRQVALGWELYTDESNNHYPANGSTTGGSQASVGENSYNPSWVAGVLKRTTFPDNTNTVLLVGDAYRSFGSIGGYVKNPGVYHCPADVSIDPGNGHSRVRSISMNSWINPGKVNTAATYWTKPFEKFTQPTGFIKVSPSNIFVFLDEQPSTINDGWLLMNMDGYNPDGSITESLLNVDDLPAVYHNKCSAFSYADGHAELHPWRGGAVLNDDDLVWLMTHATVPQ
jgi:prepilin-type N-terminal cleavage/methylation domain-containing protein